MTYIARKNATKYDFDNLNDIHLARLEHELQQKKEESQKIQLQARCEINTLDQRLAVINNRIISLNKMKTHSHQTRTTKQENSNQHRATLFSKINWVDITKSVFQKRHADISRLHEAGHWQRDMRAIESQHHWLKQARAWIPASFISVATIGITALAAAGIIGGSAGIAIPVILGIAALGLVIYSIHRRVKTWPMRDSNRAFVDKVFTTRFRTQSAEGIDNGQYGSQFALYRNELQQHLLQHTKDRILIQNSTDVSKFINAIELNEILTILNLPDQLKTNAQLTRLRHFIPSITQDYRLFLEKYKTCSKTEFDTKFKNYLNERYGDIADLGASSFNSNLIARSKNIQNLKVFHVTENQMNDYVEGKILDFMNPFKKYEISTIVKISSTSLKDQIGGEQIFKVLALHNLHATNSKSNSELQQQIKRTLITHGEVVAAQQSLWTDSERIDDGRLHLGAMAQIAVDESDYLIYEKTANRNNAIKSKNSILSSIYHQEASNHVHYSLMSPFHSHDYLIELNNMQLIDYEGRSYLDKSPDGQKKLFKNESHSDVNHSKQSDNFGHAENSHNKSVQSGINRFNTARELQIIYASLLKKQLKNKSWQESDNLKVYWESLNKVSKQSKNAVEYWHNDVILVEMNHAMNSHILLLQWRKLEASLSDVLACIQQYQELIGHSQLKKSNGLLDIVMSQKELKRLIANLGDQIQTIWKTLHEVQSMYFNQSKGISQSQFSELETREMKKLADQISSLLDLKEFETLFNNTLNTLKLNQNRFILNPISGFKGRSRPPIFKILTFKPVIKSFLGKEPDIQIQKFGELLDKMILTRFTAEDHLYHDYLAGRSQTFENIETIQNLVV